MRHLRPRELQQHLEQAKESPLLLDVREPWEYQTVRLEGSVLVPMRTVPTAMDAWAHERQIVVICHHGVRSRQVAHYLEMNGFTDVINLSGGIDAWAREVDPSMPLY
ncbi:MAG: rhodanese-like domain-containing protein [Ectothiorhodospiraceae bacterium]|jgi:rhodanese-related sulfurtransferase|nr:rhodanese-like domain-containing protein [Ectothiorhodospiraceae bacterium]